MIPKTSPLWSHFNFSSHQHHNLLHYCLNRYVLLIPPPLLHFYHHIPLLKLILSKLHAKTSTTKQNKTGFSWSPVTSLCKDPSAKNRILHSMLSTSVVTSKARRTQACIPIELIKSVVWLTHVVRRNLSSRHKPLVRAPDRVTFSCTFIILVLMAIIALFIPWYMTLKIQTGIVFKYDFSYITTNW